MLIEGPGAPFTPAAYRIGIAEDEWQRRGSMALRRAVFCSEQRVFRFDDRDEVDALAIPIVAMTCVAGMPDRVIGTVRIHPLGDGLWQGSRLAVESDFRRVAALGTELVRHAVGTARRLGCTRFIAQVQEQNVALFERLHWHSLERVDLHGRPHRLMQADLGRYPQRGVEPVDLFVAPARQAA